MVSEQVSRKGRIEAKLRTGLEAESVEVVDESHLHAGHAGAQSGKGHYRIRVVSKRFAGLSRIESQRLVFAVLAEEMESDIHALAMQTLVPPELDS